MAERQHHITYPVSKLELRFAPQSLQQILMNGQPGENQYSTQQHFAGDDFIGKVRL